jgi:hypothetical protein
LLATSDKNGNLIIWKILNSSQFKILTEIENLSETNITYLLWSNDGNYLFVSNSYGSVYILEFNEYTKSNVIVPPNIENNNKISFGINLNNNLYNENKRRRITPELINSSSQIINNNQPTIQTSSIIPNQILNPNQLIQDCLRCQKQKFDSLENKIVCLKLDSFENKNVCFQWENKIYDNYSTVQLRMKNNNILYANKFENKLIRLFSCNNYFYALYDTNNLMTVFTFFNTMVSF